MSTEQAAPGPTLRPHGPRGRARGAQALPLRLRTWTSMHHGCYILYRTTDRIQNITKLKSLNSSIPTPDPPAPFQFSRRRTSSIQPWSPTSRYCSVSIAPCFPTRKQRPESRCSWHSLLQSIRRRRTTSLIRQPQRRASMKLTSPNHSHCR